MILRDIDQSVNLLQIIPESRIVQLGSIDGLPDYRTVVHVIDERGLNVVEVAQLRSQLGTLVDSFGKEVRHFLQELNQAKYRWYCIGNEYRKRRDHLVAAGYKPQTQLQARMWKMALQASSIIVSNYWRLAQVKALETMRKRPYFNRFTQEERTYVFSMLGSLSRSFFEMLDGAYPMLNPSKEKNLAWKTRKYLCQEMVRRIRAVKGRAPVHDEHRSAWFDVDCYSQTVLKDWVELSVMTLERGKRLKFRIKGTMPVRSTIKIVRRQNGSFAVHVIHPLKVKLEKIVPNLPKGHLYATALDMDYTEVWTDFKGEAYGKGLGEVLTEYAEAVNKKIAARNQVFLCPQKSRIGVHPLDRNQTPASYSAPFAPNESSHSLRFRFSLQSSCQPP